ncbi:hypothetical protein [Paenibacillus illinoisensis]|uniref:hypothetical protein n=1 Tax=Paenibacillus illinoisensis TaxID=59845 RepID=UPI00301DE23A
MSTADQQKIVETATTISTEHIKQYYNAEFVVTSHDVDDPSIHSRLYLYDYVTTDYSFV